MRLYSAAGVCVCVCVCVCAHMVCSIYCADVNSGRNYKLDLEVYCISECYNLFIDLFID